MAALASLESYIWTSRPRDRLLGGIAASSGLEGTSLRCGRLLESAGGSAGGPAGAEGDDMVAVWMIAGAFEKRKELEERIEGSRENSRRIKRLPI